MVLLVFKIIFLVVFVVGTLITFAAPLFYKSETKKSGNQQGLSRRITKLRLIGIIVGAVGLLVVLILGYFG